ncbi:MAG: Gldg family protein [Pseudomonadales bacterium]|jgi:ABC-2 type transport system permease protein|nr:Gldg family protein [Pseudomonadales bacterium]
MADVLRIARKEFRGYFASPAAYLFIGAFLAATLFVFFWVETFFARNLADVAPLFRWLPLLLIFLVAALTMRAWSEERRAGTLEALLTAPVRPLDLVLGKFLAALALVMLAVALTLPLPVTVALLGPLDWGPVFGGYVATTCLAAAYVAIGLWTSSRTDNPVVALILTAAICTGFWLVGSEGVTSLFGHEAGGVLALLGTGSRFESITRGVLDFRDLYYYASIVGVFLTLNLYGLERLRWAAGGDGDRHRAWQLGTGLALANLVVANLWLADVTAVRADLTADGRFSLSDTTREQLASLDEPLLIRGYFSERTHPLLAPLVPRLRDLLEEYAVAGGDSVRVEFLDPTTDSALEEEAASRFGIRPVPFQTADRYESAVVSSYFDLVIAYGDEFEALGFRDLVEVRSGGERELDVLLKNPEYALTRSIHRVVGAWRAGGDAFAALPEGARLTAYVSPAELLPESLQAFRREVESLFSDLETRGALATEIVDPDAGDGGLAAELEQRYGLGPMLASLFDPQPFWFQFVLEAGGDAFVVPMPETLDAPSLERSLEAAAERLAPGFLRTVTLVSPPDPTVRHDTLRGLLEENVRVQSDDLSSGEVPRDTDLLLVLAPEALTEAQLFAVDQFLMRGGAVVLATSPWRVTVDRALSARRQDSGLGDWLAHHGIEIDEALVLDARNAALPVPVERYIGGLPIREIRMLDYPHFPDLRGDSLATHPITAALEQLTLNWASPIHVAERPERSVSELLRSSADSWTSASTELVPDYTRHPDTGFEAPEERGSEALAVALEGRFESWFAERGSPLAAAAEGEEEAAEAAADERPTSVITRSPDTARLVVIASNAFASDTAIELASQGLGTWYTRPAEFLQNTVDWALEDPGLLSLRGRTGFARTLDPLAAAEPEFWEFLNYGLALAGLLAVVVWRRRVAAADRDRYQHILAEV